jgi:hypothetical protein
VCICKEILPPLDSATIELCQIMTLKIIDVSLQNQVFEDETIGQFHNITQVCIQSLMLCNIHELNLCGIHYMLNL